MNKANGTFSIVSWNETTKKEQEKQKTTIASVEYKIDGIFEGHLSVEYAMFYSEFDPADVHAGTAEFAGTIWFTGELSGLSGSFGALDRGVYSSGQVKSNFEIVKGSGKGKLAGIKGSGTYSASKDGMKIELSYEI